jgi:hypothetical protein
VGAVRAAASVFVSHCQLQVFTSGVWDYLEIYTVGDELLHLNGEDVLTVFTGVHTAEVDVVVSVDAAAPPDEPGWIVASEATLWCPDGRLTVCGLMGDCPDELREIPVPGPGLVRVRARGRDISPETDPGPEQPPEKYELHVWPVAEDTGLRTVRPDDAQPGWEQRPARAASWAVLRMITRMNPDAQRRNLLRAAAATTPVPPVPRVDVRRSHPAPVDLLDRPADLFGATPDGDDLLVPVGDQRVRLQPLAADPGALRFRWTWEPAPEPVQPEPMTVAPDEVPTEVELRLDPDTGELTVHHRQVRAPDAVLLGWVWEHFLDRAGRADGAEPHPWEEVFATRAAAARQRAEDDRRRRAAAEDRRWGGRAPSERVRTLPANSWALARLDRPLVDGLDRVTPDEQRTIARWAAGRAAEVAGLAAVDWIAPALAAVHAGAPLPPPFDDHRRSWDRLLSDPAVPRTTVTVPYGPPNCLQQAMAFPAITAAVHEDPLAAAVETLYCATIAHGDDHPRFLAEVHATFPGLE